MLCKSATLTTALAAISIFASTAQAYHAQHLGKAPVAKRHASIRSAFSPRTRIKRQDFLHTTQPGNLAEGSATADEGCTLWIQPWADASCLAIITYSPGLILEDFLELNTAIDSSCTNLESNVAYCIDTDDSHEESSNVSTQTNNAVAAKGSSCRRKSKSAGPTATAQPADVGSKTSPAPASSSSSKKTKGGGKVIGVGSGLLELDDPVCGPSDPTKETTNDGGPNGKISWLNCGISKSDPSSGWTYPTVKLNELVYHNLSKDGVYAPCAPYFQYFEEAESQYGIPAIFFAAFAMQESTCNPNASGDEGHAFGLMQITSDKCGDAPGGNCNDPEYNVLTAAKYFSDVLNGQCGGNPLCAVGQYNGWNKGMSYASATASVNSCCVCQNNLDYMTQFFNGWLLGLNGVQYTYYDNLRSCSSWWNGK